MEIPANRVPNQASTSQLYQDYHCLDQTKCLQHCLKEPLDLLQKLYDTKDKLFSHEAAVRCQMLASQQADVLIALDQSPSKKGVREKALRFYIRGKALDVTEEYVSEAEELLGRAVKLDPTLGDGWNQLGTCFWKKGDYQAAHDCWQCSLLHAGDQADSARCALRELSMAHRSKGGNAEESLRLAKEAISRDMGDARSWYNLGTAYLSFFFASSLDPDDLTRALRAYNRAAADAADANPDLHYNRLFAPFQVWPTPGSSNAALRRKIALPVFVAAHGISPAVASWLLFGPSPVPRPRTEWASAGWF